MVWQDLVTFDLPWFGPVWSENRVPSPSPPWFTAWLTRVMVLKRSVCVPTSFHQTLVNYWENVEFAFFFLCIYFLFIIVGSPLCPVISSFLLMCVEERGPVCPPVSAEWRYQNFDRDFFSRYQIFRNWNRDFFQEKIFQNRNFFPRPNSLTMKPILFPRPNFPKPIPKPSKNWQRLEFK